MTDVEEVYYNDGRKFSGSSAAVRYGRFLLIGSHCLYCLRLDQKDKDTMQ